MIEIICYTGGTCGDLLAAIIDPRDSKFHQGAIMHEPARARLKKPHLFMNDVEKDQYIDNIGQHYLSIPSHDLNYHIDKKHSFIGVTVEDKKIANWAASRFKSLHRKEVWESMTKACSAETVDEYAQVLIDYSGLVSKHTNRLIRLEDIISGRAIKSLANLGIDNCSENLYKNWLDLKNGHFVI